MTPSIVSLSVIQNVMKALQAIGALSLRRVWTETFSVLLAGALRLSVVVLVQIRLC